ncbi:3-hydroxyacyl-CoA dehydrogenase [Pleomassaria siparia CBS 279.74]|uniref:3-hydroxyacyl-CoA dehydrogenase n=1 Tax=Pleomassaria siparia CBS 279.74 TaxID=1314801 RepID=A0A6G1JS90_9PLEO|nr:3-hydroxyacyl-CoA dehydrogenase [Pleomassaria siparia CBS 279.74]
MSNSSPDQESTIQRMNFTLDLKITLIGAGTIGLSFAAFHLSHLLSASTLTIYDTRPNAEQYIRENLTQFYGAHLSLPLSKLVVAQTLEEAVSGAHIVQESGPENLTIKRALWVEVEKYAPKDALLWSSTSGIPASQQAQDMQDKTRLLVVHPYNPPHIMPLLELVPSPATNPRVIRRTEEFWQQRGRVPILIQKEVTGFVANRLAFALLRESIHLVNSGVVSVTNLDRIVESSMGPRWAVAGPFKSYHAGGGPAGLEGFFKNIGDTVQECWDDAGQINVGDGWEEKIFNEAREVYGTIDTDERNRVTRRLLDVLEEEKEKGTRKEGSRGLLGTPLRSRPASGV